VPSGGIAGLARTLSYYTRLHEVTASNLANAASEGFKADRITAALDPVGVFPVPVQKLDLSQGPLRTTGRALDIALQGDGFLVVRTASGERLIRGGSLELDGAGLLTDRHGNPVLDSDGKVVALPPGEVVIDSGGTIHVAGSAVARLKLVTASPGQLRKEGHNRFVSDGETQPVAEGSVRVHQGQLEDANVDTLSGMVDLVLMQRAYTASVEALRTMDGVLASVTSDVARI
jgi:flagellar basal-body rod protein FlgF